ncbi:MAG TPA: hypothetical protein VNM48_06420 [Chloroflexota bacterium]|nr:hypothetical protein [Chloroflexota bacterium]
MSDTARRKAYAEVTEVVKTAFARYLEEFPERAGDGRNLDAVQWSLRGVQRIFRVLDRFEFTEKPQPKDKPP